PENASAVLDALPAGPTLAQMVVAEKQFGPVWLIQRLKKAEQRKPDSWRAAWKEDFEIPTAGGEGPSREVKSVATFEQAIKMLEGSLPLYDELAKLSALPWKEYDAQYPEFVKKARAANPLTGYLLPTTYHIVATERRTRARMALFKAALAVVQGGK